MILVRSPLRITLGGGGTDLPVYAQEFGGFCLTAAITQYVYVSVIRPFEPGIYLKYSELERVPIIAEVKHPIIRAGLVSLQIPAQIEITTLADVPAGTGLGSSSSFTTALLKALAIHQYQHVASSEALAKAACELERDRVGAPIGPQDHYAAALGGLLQQIIRPDGTVIPTRLPMSSSQMEDLCDRLVLYFTGYTRQTANILTMHSTAALHEVKALGYQSCQALEAGDWSSFGELLHAHWQAKRQRSVTMSNSRIDAWYELGRSYGAIGGKLVGAGGGGCLLFLTQHPQTLRAGLKNSGLQEIRFRFDCEGTKVLTT